MTHNPNMPTNMPTTAPTTPPLTTEILNASILIVDDQLGNVQLLTQLLEESGYTHVSATMQPSEVCALQQQSHFDLILLDLHMPVMDGFAVMEALQTNHPDDYLSVIVLTADPSAKLRALQAGAKDFISKPFDLAEVRARIHNLLEVRLLYKKLALHNELLEQTVQLRTAELAASEQRFKRLTELASDWYWEQNESGSFTTVSGPVQEMMGIRVSAFMGGKPDAQAHGWNDDEREALQAKVFAREPFLDFPFSRIRSDGRLQHFRVSGEPMFDSSSRYTGYRGIGAEVVPHSPDFDKKEPAGSFLAEKAENGQNMNQIGL